MDWKQITGLVVGVVIAALLLTTILVPIIGEATTTEKTFTNEGFFYLQEYTGDDIEYSAKWDHTKPTSFTVNDVEIPITYTENLNTSIVLDGNFFLRYVPATGVSLYYGSQAIVEANLTNGYDMTLSYSSGTLTITNGTASREISVETFYSIATEGDYVMKKPTVQTYMNGDSLIYGAGRTGSGDNILGSLVSGTVEDVDVTVWRGTYEVSDIEVTKTTVNGYDDLYLFDKVTFKATNTETTTVQNVTYNYVVVPYQVTAELSQHLDGSSIALLSIVPLLITVGIIMAVVGLFVIRRE